MTIDEERRLAYVGIIVPRRNSDYVVCKERRQYGDLARPELSRFLLSFASDI